MTTDDLKAWVDCIRQRRYADLSTAVWDLLWLAAQHRSFVLRPKPGVGLEFLLDGEESRVYPLADNVGWLRAILARMGSLLKDSGAVTAGIGHYGFKARIKAPDGSGAERAFEIEMKNNQRAGVSLAVRRVEHAVEPLPEIDSDGPVAGAE